AESERLGFAGEEEEVAEVEGRLDAGDRGDRDLEQRVAVAKRPLVRARGTEAIAEGAEESFALGGLRHPLARGREIVRAREGTEVRGKRGRVEQVVAGGEHLEQGLAPAVAGPAKAARALARCGRDRVFGLLDFFLELRARVEVQPALVLERVIAHLVSARDELRDCGRVALYRRVEADDEEGDAESERLEGVERDGQESREMRRTRLPPLVAADFHVRPEIVDVERDAAERTLRHGRPPVPGSRAVARAWQPGGWRGRRSR